MKIKLLNDNNEVVEIDLEEICAKIGIYGTHFYLLCEEIKNEKNHTRS